MKNRSSLNSLFSHNRKAMYIVLGIVMASVLTLTVVYAALSTTLNINGTAEVSSANWNIHLDNVQLNSNSATIASPTITNSTTASFSTELKEPGDFYEFTIDVVNDGSIDAMINGITKTPALTEVQAKYLNYIVEYQNGEPINNKQLVSKGFFVRLRVKVEFRNDITASELPTQSETLNLSFTVNYVQADGSESNVTNNGIVKKIIEFAITDEYDGNNTGTYQAEEGMTWEEWVNSEYNPGDFVISSIVIKDNQFSCYLSLDGTPVRPEHVIEAEQSYIIDFGGGSN